MVGSTAAAGGGLALGFHLPSGAASARAETADGVEVNAWVVIKPDDTCMIRIARTEMGQGTRTGLAQLVAEELECDWKKVTTELHHARPEPRPQAGVGRNGHRRQPRHPHLAGLCPPRRRRRAHDAAAGGGRSVEGAGRRAHRLRRHHHPCGDASAPTSYGKVAAAAAKLTPPDPKSITLKDPRNWKIAGKPMKRLDTADKLNGSKVYAIDVKLPGMLCAAIKDCPVFGGKLKSYDEAKIAGRPGVKRRRQGEGQRRRGGRRHLVAGEVRARGAADRVGREARTRPRRAPTIAAHLRDGFDAATNNGNRENGDAVKAIEGAAKKVEAIYSTPFLAHATMEPMNCTAKISADKAEAWVPSQNAEASLAALSEASGLPLDKCEVYRLGPRRRLRPARRPAGLCPSGGRHRQELPGYAGQADLVAARRTWRTTSTGRSRSAKMSAGLDEQGNLVGLHVRISGQSINAFLESGGDLRRQGHAPAAGL